MLFKSQKQLKNDKPSDTSSDHYQMIIGDHGLYDPSTSQSMCHSNKQIDLTASSVSSFDQGGHSGYRNVFRNYTSSPHHVVMFVFLATYFLLLLLGTSVFAIFEQKAEFELRDRILRVQQTFLNKHPGVDPDSLDEFISQVLKAADSGVNLHLLNQLIKIRANEHHSDSISQTTAPTTPDQIGSNSKPEANNEPNQAIRTLQSKEKEDDSELSIELNGEVNTPTEHSNWEFTSSLLFVTSVVTTIGYGHVTPITFEGKLFAMVFACVGIPFTLVFFSVIVTLIKNGPVKRFEKWLIKTIRNNFEQIPEFFSRILHVIIVTLILLVLILLLPALILFNLEEDWSFLDSIYYCYISLTTVGLGDLVATTNHMFYWAYLHIYRICIVLYLYGGLCLIMVWIAVILRIPQLNLKPFLLTEEEEIDEETRVLAYADERSHLIGVTAVTPHSYGTQVMPQK